MSGFLARARKASKRGDQVRSGHSEDPKALKVAPNPNEPAKAKEPVKAPKKRAENGQAKGPKALPVPSQPLQPKRERATYLGKAVHFEGVIRSECSLHVDGHVKGRIEAPDAGITIGPGGHVEADLVADRVNVDGRVIGSVVALGRLEVRSTGSIQGDVRTSRLVMEEGGLLSGALHMEPPAKPKMRELPPRHSNPRPAIDVDGTRK